MGLTSGIAKVISLGWIALIAWGIDRVSKLETDEPWEPRAAVRAARTLPFEGVALAGTANAEHLGSETFLFSSPTSARPAATVDPERNAVGDGTLTLVAGIAVDRVLPALLQAGAQREPEFEPPPIDPAAAEMVVAIGPMAEELSGATGEDPATLDVAANVKPHSGEPRSYRVVRGDTLQRILKREFGTLDPTLVKAFFDANPRLKKNPNRIQIGADLTLPAWPGGAAMKQDRATPPRS